MLPSPLAMLPVEDVIDGFEILVEVESIPDELISYFEVNYIGCEIGQGTRRRRIAPKCPIEQWDVHERIKTGLPRTKNGSEGNNNAMKSNITRVNPNIWALIEALKNEEQFRRRKMAHLKRGDQPKKKNKV